MNESRQDDAVITPSEHLLECNSKVLRSTDTTTASSYLPCVLIYSKSFNLQHSRYFGQPLLVALEKRSPYLLLRPLLALLRRGMFKWMKT
jgi:hypothetical protein